MRRPPHVPLPLPALLLLFASAPCLGAAPGPPPARAAAAAAPTPPLPPAVAAAAAAIDGRRLEADVRFLADDLLEGRGTGTRGHEIAARFVAERMRALGLEPAGAGDRSYLQPVPFLRARLDTARSACALVRGGEATPLALGRDVILSPDLLRDRWTTEAPLEFVGYGVSAPEFGYDDFAGVDVRGKVLVEFRGAPPRFPNDPRAYYSSARTKERLAAAQGAVGILTVMRPEDERRVPWARVLRQSALPAMRWTDAAGAPANTQALLELGGTLSRSGAEAVFAGAPRTLAQAFADGDSSRPQAFPLVPAVRAVRVTERTRVTSPNVVGLLRGSDPRLARECLVLSAHLDHLGIGVPVEGDSIHNGAYDNASGSAILLELARAFAGLRPRPRRSLLFLSTTGEEKGLQGADYFAQQPPPAGLEIVGDVNVDEVLMLGPITTVVGFGAEHSSLGPTLTRAARDLGLALAPDPRPAEVVFVRSDQYAFVQQGIPAVFPVAAGDGSPEAGRQFDEWERTRYHTPQDDLGQVFRWDEGARFARLAFDCAWRVAGDPRRPTWNPGDYFGARFAPRR